ncbi:L-rhamnose mutarotase [Commensalibacter sp. Nvir]|uniref:L-rhamnose mutarotase n=1 Tax=Commensalibacter sp. Nvir TaxID=3069817 RepID=UPI002D567D85|nr:L-rhamnose mutarotase [Commensalibacter sp. Nvir]
MIRKAFIMPINNNAHEEYIKRHNPIWKALEQVLKKHGSHNYSIFLDKKRNLLFGYLEIESEEQWESISKTEVCRQWWEYMSELMPTNPDNSPQHEDLVPVFYLS